jgi:hypothetical protein
MPNINQRPLGHKDTRSQRREGRYRYWRDDDAADATAGIVAGRTRRRRTAFAQKITTAEFSERRAGRNAGAFTLSVLRHNRGGAS